MILIRFSRWPFLYRSCLHVHGLNVFKCSIGEIAPGLMNTRAASHQLVAAGMSTFLQYIVFTQSELRIKVLPEKFVKSRGVGDHIPCYGTRIPPPNTDWFLSSL